MDNAEAAWWVAGGLAAIAAGGLLLRAGDPILLPLWGTALIVVGTVASAVGVGVLLRLWR